jgi:8-oxo-dGTP diphosphatase
MGSDEKPATPRAGRHCYDYPRPAVTVDLALFTVTPGRAPRLQVLLVERDEAPFRGQWALPGGFLREGEDLPGAARRELAEETGAEEPFLEQVAAVGTPGRDPRGQTVTVVYMALVAPDRHRLRAGGDARRAAWHDVDGLGALAFDHRALMEMALAHLRKRLGETRACFELVPAAFTLGELQGVCEAILGRPLDRRNFRRKVEEAGIVAALEGRRRGGSHRPAQLYRFDGRAFERFVAAERALPF